MQEKDVCDVPSEIALATLLHAFGTLSCSGLVILSESVLQDEKP